VVYNEQIEYKYEEKMEIGIFGVTANPVHLGHWQAIECATKIVDEVWVSPVFKHPFGKSFIAYDLRKEMLRLIFEEFPLPKVRLLELDKEYCETMNEMVYSYKLLTYLKDKYPEHNFKLVVGEDNYKPEVWNKFYEHDKIDAEFGVVVVPDRGSHSTHIRELLKNGLSAANLVGKAVENLIITHKLYKEA
jgi:nicotinate-nucleotide adenylyltransferase